MLLLQHQHASGSGSEGDVGCKAGLGCSHVQWLACGCLYWSGAVWAGCVVLKVCEPWLVAAGVAAGAPERANPAWLGVMLPCQWGVTACLHNTRTHTRERERLADSVGRTREMQMLCWLSWLALVTSRELRCQSVLMQA